MTSKEQFKLFINFSFVAILIFAVHYFLLFYFRRYFYAPNVLWINPFLFVLSFFSILIISIILKKNRRKNITNVYMLTILGKIIFSLLFLLPLFINNSVFKKEFVIQFFIFYFVYLIIELFCLIKITKNG